MPFHLLRRVGEKMRSDAHDQDTVIHSAIWHIDVSCGRRLRGGLSSPGIRPSPQIACGVPTAVISTTRILIDGIAADARGRKAGAPALRTEGGHGDSWELAQALTTRRGDGVGVGVIRLGWLFCMALGFR